MPLTKQQMAARELWNESRSISDADFFTLGYGGRRLEEIMDALQEAGVRTLVDIRQNPISRFRPELHKARLQRFLEKRGVHYEHLPSLGVPREIRVKAINEGQRHTIWPWYDQHVIPGYIGRNLHRFLNSVEHPIVMMCVEADPTDCHRHRLFWALEAKGLRGYDL